MTVLVLGNHGFGQLARYISRGLRQVGLSVVDVSDDLIAPKSLLARALTRSGFATFHLSRQRALDQIASQLIEAKGSVVVVVKGSFVPRRFIEQIRERMGVSVVNWYPDDPFIRLPPTVPLGTLRAYDLVVSYSPRIVPRLHQAGVNAALIPFGYDPVDYFVSPQSRPDCDVAFVGQYSPHRERTLMRLLEAGITVRVAGGAGWHKSQVAKRGAWDDSPRFGQDACAVYHSARVGVNILHPTNNAGSHNMRTWEVLASGVPLVTTDTDQQRALLDGISGVRFFEGADDIVSVVRSVLRDPDRPRVDQLHDHTYAERCARLLRLLPATRTTGKGSTSTRDQIVSLHSR